MILIRRMLLAAAGIVAAGGPAAAQSPRRMVPVTLEELHRLDDPTGTLLSLPALVRLCDDELVILDIGLAQVVRLGRDLRLKWRFGREGGGPLEFRAPLDVACDGRGRVWVPDPGNGRIVRLTAHGEVDSLFVTTVGHERIAVSDAGKLWSISGDPLILVTAQTGLGGAPVATRTPPFLTSAPSLLREAWMSPVQSGGIVIGFRWTDEMVRVDESGSIRYTTRGPERVGLPRLRSYPVGNEGRDQIVRVEADAVEAVSQLTASDGIIYVLFAGASRNAGRIIDRFDEASGRYLDSFTLPISPVSFAIDRDMLFALQLEPAPIVLAYRMRRQQESARAGQ